MDMLPEGDIGGGDKDAYELSAKLIPARAVGGDLYYHFESNGRLYFMTGDAQFLDVGLDLDFSAEDPFENAARLLKAATGFTDGRVQAELNWYSKEQCYPLSYLTGNRMVWELKNELIAANRKQLSTEDLDREFHRIYLQSGCMPVASLREVFQHEGFL